MDIIAAIKKIQELPYGSKIAYDEYHLTIFKDGSLCLYVEGRYVEDVPMDAVLSEQWFVIKKGKE